MSRRLRDAFGGGTSRKAADAAVGHGMADVLAALDNVIDDDAALARIYAGLGKNVPAAAPGWGAGTAADEVCARIGMPGSAITTARASGTAACRRRLALRSVAGVAAALTAAAVALAVVVPGARHLGTEGPAVNTAYVVKRVDSALSAAGPGAIAQMTVTTSSAAISGGTTATTTAEEWSYGDRWRSVTYSAAGHLVYDEGSSTASVYTVVSYQERTWARQPRLGRAAALAPGARGCEPVVAALPLPFQPRLPVPGVSASSLPATVARALRAAVSCGALAVAGRQRVDGIEAIELTSSPDSPIAETIWVSPGTYLPVRVVVHSAPGTPGTWQTADITWLAPTVQNLARLTVPIPAGFRQVPLAQAVRRTCSTSRAEPRYEPDERPPGLEALARGRRMLRRMRWPRTGLLAIVAGIALLTAACSGSPSAAGGSGGAPAAVGSASSPAGGSGGSSSAGKPATNPRRRPFPSGLTPAVPPPRAVCLLPHVTGQAIAATIFLGIGPSAIGFVLWAYAMSRMDVGRVTVPMRRQTMCGWPSATGVPKWKVAPAGSASVWRTASSPAPRPGPPPRPATQPKGERKGGSSRGRRAPPEPFP
jgi:hypothetical protein